jgi:glucose-1-phosphate thymidylyltransferase
VAIDEHSVIRNAIVEDSILGAYSRLDSIVLKGSILGNDASITGSWHSINIGDNTELNLRN